ncbi:hypothetical protein HN011_011453 [Eciton burchellii]|nr:hypothetical protein HN011_011453 [Eciton burchellii]
MKGFVFVACFLMVAYAADPEKVKTFYKAYNECVNELGLPKTDYMQSKALKCLGDKQNLYDSNGEFDKDKLFAYVKDLFITGHEKQGLKIISKCLDKGYQTPGSNYQKNIAIIECTLKKNITDHIPKPE